MSTLAEKLEAYTGPEQWVLDLQLITAFDGKLNPAQIERLKAFFGPTDSVVIDSGPVVLPDPVPASNEPQAPKKPRGKRSAKKQVPQVGNSVLLRTSEDSTFEGVKKFLTDVHKNWKASPKHPEPSEPFTVTKIHNLYDKVALIDATQSGQQFESFYLPYSAIKTIN